jgi:hypoxanthine-DNA glycosylase
MADRDRVKIAAELKTAFPPVVGPAARALILGSMPGEASLRQQQYYGHPRNAFWPILCELLGIPPQASYADRCAALVGHGIALWDVIAACERPGSLDQAIRPETVRVNDFGAFFDATPGVVQIVFNGGTAEREYRRRVLPALQPPHCEIQQHRLPSTSPAHAALRFEQKRAAWRSVLGWLVV